MLSLKRIQTIFIKDYKDLMKNSYMLSTAIMPLLFAFLFGRGEEVELIVSIVPITLAMVIVGSFVQAAMIAEEKEKNTLRGLLLSPLSTSEVFIGKSLLSAVLTAIMIAGVILISGFPIPENTLLFIVAIFISLVIYIGIGTILGLMSRTVMETTVVGMPVLIIFGMSSLFRNFFESEWLYNILSYLPDGQFATLVLNLHQGLPVGENLVILGIWALVTIVITVLIYKRRRFD
ncbi:ABC transporter permease [Alkalihalobacillus sp. 1P02AB]|uniref:ABC transporter permease n=1 Tax=Alkalihalobacillus sp. 1P02AB TaxID=3132260 RepID=UPI0039A4DA9B